MKIAVESGEVTIYLTKDTFYDTCLTEEPLNLLCFYDEINRDKNKIKERNTNFEPEYGF